MKLNKKLLMAALAGAIVVGGSTGVFADGTQFELEQNAPGIPKAVDSESKKMELKAAKEEAIKELKAAGVTSDLLLNQIRKAKSIASVNALKAELLKSHEASKPRVTIDQWNLKNAKEDAIKELKAAGITSDFLLNRIRSAKTIEGVNALKAELLKAHKEQKPEVKPNPSKPERQPSTPEGPYAPYAPEKGKEEKPGKDQKPENKKPENKKPEDKKPENKKPENKKPENKKPNKKKENTDSPNKKKKEKAKLPKAGSEAEILTLAAASLSSVAGAFISLKKRK